MGDDVQNTAMGKSVVAAKTIIAELHVCYFLCVLRRDVTHTCDVHSS